MRGSRKFCHGVFVVVVVFFFFFLLFFFFFFFFLGGGGGVGDQQLSQRAERSNWIHGVPLLLEGVSNSISYNIFEFSERSGPLPRLGLHMCSFDR